MKTIEEYQRDFKLFSEELDDFKEFMSDPKQIEYTPIGRIIVKNDDELAIMMGRLKSIYPE